VSEELIATRMALECAEAELRETAGELEKARARLAEATELLTWGANECEPATSDFPDAVGVFLSRAPAQPAAPEPTAYEAAMRCSSECTNVYEVRDSLGHVVNETRDIQAAAREAVAGGPNWTWRMKPAAPEPSELQKRLDAINAMRERAETAEAQLAAATNESMSLHCRIDSLCAQLALTKEAIAIGRREHTEQFEARWAAESQLAAVQDIFEVSKATGWEEIDEGGEGPSYRQIEGMFDALSAIRSLLTHAPSSGAGERSESKGGGRG
jgi:hypothetical protein